MQRVAAGVIEQLRDGPAGKFTDAKCLRHGHQILAAQAIKQQPGDPVIAGGEPAPSFAQAAQLTGPGRHQRQHPVGSHAPQSEQQRPGRRFIGPVEVVDHHHDDLVAGLQVAQGRHNLGSDGHRVGIHPPCYAGGGSSGSSHRTGGRQELIDEPPG